MEPKAVDLLLLPRNFGPAVVILLLFPLCFDLGMTTMNDCLALSIAFVVQLVLHIGDPLQCDQWYHKTMVIVYQEINSFQIPIRQNYLTCMQYIYTKIYLIFVCTLGCSLYNG
jgi:hypothetical protein